MLSIASKRGVKEWEVEGMEWGTESNTELWFLPQHRRVKLHAPKHYPLHDTTVIKLSVNTACRITMQNQDSIQALRLKNKTASPAFPWFIGNPSFCG